MIQRTALLLALLASILPVSGAWLSPARAQMSPPAGNLQLPSARPPATPPRPDATARSAPATPSRPQAAPRTPVQHAPPTVRPQPGPAAQHAPNARPGTHPAQPARPPRPGARPATPPAVPVVPVPAPTTTPAPEPATPEPSKGSSSGLPLPRFASLRSDEVNLRTGPGIRYPIDWVYKRRDLPVQIEREFEVWRLVRDQEGVKGWIHQATLAPRRTAVVVGQERPLRRDAREDATPVAQLKPGVIVRLRSCEAASPWCQVQVAEYRGWLRRDEMWGIMPAEAIQ